METIGERLRRVRERKLLTQADLSTASGVTEATISRIETGQAGPTRPSTAKKLARALGLDPIWLMYGEDEAEGKMLAAA